MHFPILVVVWVIVKAIQASQSSGGGGKGGRAAPVRTPGGRGGLWWAPRLLLTWALLAIPVGLGSSFGLVGVVGLAGAPVALAAVPELLVAGVAVPLGLPRLAQALGAVSLLRWWRDPAGSGNLAAARALLHQDAPAPASIAWLEARLERASPLLPGTVLAAGLVRAVRGDREEARRLAAAAVQFRLECTPRQAASLAQEWLVLDAAAAGDWKAAAGPLRDPKRASFGTRLVVGAGRRLLGADEPSARTLWRDWALAGRWSATEVLVRRALAASPAAPATAPAVEATLEAALGRHAALIARPSAAALQRAAATWEAALADPATRERIRARGAELGARTDAVTRLAAQVADELRAVATEHDLPLAGAGSLLAGAGASARDAAMADFEVATAALARRVEARRELPAILELREVLALRAQYERLATLGGPLVRRMMFRRLHDPTLQLAVWLFNKRSQKPLANALFTWLCAEAVAVGDPSAAEVNGANARVAF